MDSSMQVLGAYTPFVIISFAIFSHCWVRDDRNNCLRGVHLD
jgi:hypothetical protein